MLEKETPFYVDHFSIATTRRDRPIDPATKLSPITAGCYTDRTVHSIFESSYFELYTYQPDTIITWLTRPVPAISLPKVHSCCLSVKGTDPNPVCNASIEDGIETIGEISNPSRQHVRYGEEESEAGYQTFSIQNYEPFTDILFGCTIHLAKELIVKNKTEFPHINDTKRLAYTAGYCDSKKRSEEADAAISELYSTAKGATDAGFSLDTYQPMDHDIYVAEFGCEPRNDGLKLFIVIAAFSGYHLEFVEKHAYSLNLNHFRKGGKFYVDCRRILGLFLVFMPWPPPFQNKRGAVT